MLKALEIVVLLTVIAVVVCLGWFYFYSRDVPGFAEVANFAPDSITTAGDGCSRRTVRVIPFASLGKNLESATRAAEGQNDEVFAVQIARDLFCDDHREKLKRHLLEYKASVQLRRRLTSEQLLTIYLNRSSFGPDLVGVEDASLHFFGKRASELDIAQAALIAGLIRAPNVYSPERHPDRARVRRDAVIDAMLKNGAITAEQAGAAKQSAVR